MTRRTLGFYKDFCVIAAGLDSQAVRYFQKKIDESPLGRDEPVLADEGQMFVLIAQLLKRGET